METAYCVAQAVNALNIPEEIRQYCIHINYNPYLEEWNFHGFIVKSRRSIEEIIEWVNRICSWLQCQYPRGPEWLGGYFFGYGIYSLADKII
jgi:hypothetical protein